MTSILRTSLAIAALVLGAACASSDAANTSSKATNASTPTADSASGSLASSTGIPHDSISDRADLGRIAGDSNAKVWVIMGSDFQCPYCKAWHDAFFQSIVRDYTNKGKIRMAFINMPLSIHPNAVPAAEAAMCASVQGKFWPMHDALFAHQDAWVPAQDPSSKLQEIAQSVGVDVAKWKTCYSQHLTLPLIQADRDRLRNRGVRSTPTFIIVPTNQMVEGSDKDLHAEIEAALKGSAKP
jgi:protein-disulfide isomerase